jgi:hypothetical protein
MHNHVNEMTMFYVSAGSSIKVPHVSGGVYENNKWLIRFEKIDGRTRED